VDRFGAARVVGTAYLLAAVAVPLFWLGRHVLVALFAAAIAVHAALVASHVANQILALTTTSTPATANTAYVVSGFAGGALASSATDPAFGHRGWAGVRGGGAVAAAGLDYHAAEAARGAWGRGARGGVGGRTRGGGRGSDTGPARRGSHGGGQTASAAGRGVGRRGVGRRVPRGRARTANAARPVPHGECQTVGASRREPQGRGRKAEPEQRRPPHDRPARPVPHSKPA
jgi:hypothetical protein